MIETYGFGPFLAGLVLCYLLTRRYHPPIHQLRNELWAAKITMEGLMKALDLTNQKLDDHKK